VILVVYAHPHHTRSIAQRGLLEGIAGLPSVTVHPLYDRYPDFDIDVAAEQALLAQARLVVWQHPIYWYSPPALLKQWFEVVLMHGWAYGEGGTALAGKDCLWVTTTGAPEDGYTDNGLHAHPFESFVPVVKQTAQFCRMRWLDPVVVHGAHRIDSSDLARHAAAYRTRLVDWIGSHG